VIRPVRGWLVDTNVVSEIRKGPRADRRVMAWADRVPRVGLYLSRLTVAEIRVGIARVTDPGFQAELEAWLRDGLLPWFADRLLEVDEAVLIRWRTLAFEAKRDNYTYARPDALLAATALVHDLGVATRNEDDFARAGVRLLNPWVAED